MRSTASARASRARGSSTRAPKASSNTRTGCETQVRRPAGWRLASLGGISIISALPTSRSMAWSRGGRPFHLYRIQKGPPAGRVIIRGVGRAPARLPARDRKRRRQIRHSGPKLRRIGGLNGSVNLHPKRPAVPGAGGGGSCDGKSAEEHARKRGALQRDSRAPPTWRGPVLPAVSRGVATFL